MNFCCKVVFALLALTAIAPKQPWMVTAIRDDPNFASDFEVADELQDLIDDGSLTSFNSVVTFLVPDSIVDATEEARDVFVDGVFATYNRLQVLLVSEGVLCAGQNEQLLIGATILAIGNERFFEPTQIVVSSKIWDDSFDGGRRLQGGLLMPPWLDGLAWDGGYVDVFVGLEGACSNCPANTVRILACMIHCVFDNLYVLSAYIVFIFLFFARCTKTAWETIEVARRRNLRDVQEHRYLRMSQQEVSFRRLQNTESEFSNCEDRGQELVDEFVPAYNRFLAEYSTLGPVLDALEIKDITNRGEGCGECGGDESCSMSYHCAVDMCVKNS
ncbi:MAG: hypothetical protein SGILL_001789, partial [Bacillariaceae sp.]